MCGGQTAGTERERENLQFRQALQFNQIYNFLSGFSIFVRLLYTSNLETGRLCRGKHKGCSKEEVKHCYRFMKLPSDGFLHYKLSTALTFQHPSGLLFSRFVGTEC